MTGHLEKKKKKIIFFVFNLTIILDFTHSFRHFRGELRFILYTQDEPMNKRRFPMFKSIWPKIGLGPFLYSGIQL